jgi:acyl carrier protein phosphodiesterase
MNYLGHLYFSNNDQELMLNNLYGDFIKGKKINEFSLCIQKGVKLHRSIDNYIDNHHAVKKLLPTLYPLLPKVSSVAVDLMFDHLLAKNWNRFHSQNLNDFLNNFYNSIHFESSEYDNQFKLMISKMISVNWISYYPTIEGLEKACHGVSKRISFPNQLHRGKEVFLLFEDEISNAFETYMIDAIQVFNVNVPKKM